MLATREGPGDCCCEELRQLHGEKEDNLNRIADTWKQKTHIIANEFQQKLQGVRDENSHLKLQTYESIEKMRLYQHQVISEILRKQEEMVLSYDRKLRKKEKENKALNQRVVQHRNSLVTKRMAN